MGGLQRAAVNQRQAAALHRAAQARRRRKRRKRVPLYQQRAPLRLLHNPSFAIMLAWSRAVDTLHAKTMTCLACAFNDGLDINAMELLGIKRSVPYACQV